MSITRTLITLSILLTWQGMGFGNSIVSGKLSNIGLLKDIEITVNEKYLNNELIVYSAKINRDGSFIIPLEIHEPQLVSLTYSHKKAFLYLEPFDTLEVYGSAGSFPNSLSFSGKGGANNNYLLEYYKKNPPERNEFKLKQYRASDTYWYVNTPQMDSWMLSMNPPSFKSKLDARKQNAMSSMDFYVANHPGKLSREFREYISSEIIYDWAYHLLLYGAVFKNRYGIQSDFFNFLDEVPLQSEAIGNYWYRHFILAYLSHRYLEAPNSDNAFSGQYDLASDLFMEKPKAFLQSEMLVKGFRSDNVDPLLRKYWNFIDYNTYEYFDDKVLEVYYQTMRYTDGAPAPAFTLANANGAAVSLEDYRGKVIYLNFWASWCRPCMSKIQLIKNMQSRLEQAGIVFLNVSLDRDKSTWLQTLSSYGIGGVNILANGDIDSDIAKNYEIKILPQYYIIDKRGNFASKPKEHDLAQIESILSRLNNEN